MPSTFDAMYGDQARPFLLEYHGAKTLIDYTMGGVTTNNITAMIGHIETSEIETDDGTIRKEYRVQIAVSRSALFLGFVGVDDPQLGGVFTFYGFQWAVENRNAFAIEGRSESFVTLNLFRKRPVDKTSPELRQY